MTETKQSISPGPLLGNILGLQLAVAWQHPQNVLRGTGRRERAAAAVGVREPWQGLLHSTSLPHTLTSWSTVFSDEDSYSFIRGPTDYEEKSKHPQESLRVSAKTPVSPR